MKSSILEKVPYPSSHPKAKRFYIGQTVVFTKDLPDNSWFGKIIGEGTFGTVIDPQEARTHDERFYGNSGDGNLYILTGSDKVLLISFDLTDNIDSIIIRKDEQLVVTSEKPRCWDLFLEEEEKE